MYDFFSPLMLLFIAMEEAIGVRGDFKHSDSIWSPSVNCTRLKSEANCTLILEPRVVHQGKPQMWGRGLGLCSFTKDFFLFFPEPQFPYCK